jgi:2-keto-4-pentenoate hydratase/2-oxohepta-3-ene-1,7-dioic acid hydratase in catechol pathway
MIRPGKIVCVGKNYVDHAKEMGGSVPKEPLIFQKPISSIVTDGQSVVLPPETTHVEHEGEIGVIVGKRLRRATPEEAGGAVQSIIAVNDVTARDLQRNEPQWTRGKGFDTFCPVGDPVEPPTDFSNVEVITRVNGEVKQRAKGSDMVFSIPTVLSYISQFMTLEPGDLVCTGTPAGVSKLSPGDEVEVEIVGYSRVKNPVVAEKTA